MCICMCMCILYMRLKLYSPQQCLVKCCKCNKQSIQTNESRWKSYKPHAQESVRIQLSLLGIRGGSLLSHRPADHGIL